MFDPSEQLDSYLRGQGYEGVQVDREASKILGLITAMSAKQPVRTPVSGALTNTMENTNAETPDSEIIDLGFDVTEADVARPVLKAATLDAEIAFVRTVRTQKDQPQLNIGYRLTETAQAVDGKTVNPGFIVFQRVLMVPSGDYTEAMKQDRLKRIHFAAVGAGHAKNTAEWVGKPVRVQVRFRDAHDGYGASNEVGGVFPMPKQAA